MRIGIFGGSFSPMHIGHAVLATYLSHCGLIDRLWLMVSRQNPLKKLDSGDDARHRLAMARLVAQECENVEASDFEFGLPLPSYSYRTLSSLKEAYPEHEFLLIIGSDNWQLFDKWASHDRLLDEFRILVYPRPGYDVRQEDMPAGVILLADCPKVEMSSTFIRETIGRGGDIHFYVPQAVEKYIKDNGLYREVDRE